jgi:hypothetical protein
MQPPECIAFSSAANKQDDVPTATNNSIKISAMSSIPMQRWQKRNARELAGMRGHEC